MSSEIPTFADQVIIELPHGSIFSSAITLGGENLIAEARAATNPASSTPIPVSHAGPKRFDFIDITRGIIMVLMSIDHQNSFIHCKHSPVIEMRWRREHAMDDNKIAYYYKDSGLEFFTRQMTHVCAPGFVFIMGIGITIVFHSRLTKLNWTLPACALTIMKRAVICFAVSEPLEMVGWMIGWLGDITKLREDGYNENDEGKGRVPMAVIFGLFTCMFFAGPTMALIHGLVGTERKNMVGPALLFAGVVVLLFCFIIMEVRDPDEEYFLDRTYRVFVAGGPNRDSPSWGPNIICRYPIMPMLGLCLTGAGFGEEILKAKHAGLHRAVPLLGLMLLTMFFLNRGFIEDDERINGSGGIAFFSLQKYPFDFSYCTFNIGILLNLFYFTDKLAVRRDRGGVRGTICNFFISIGRVPLFYYVFHLWWLGTMSLPWGLTGSCGSIWFVYAVTIFSNIFPLRMACDRFWNFKSGKPRDSYWKLF